MTLGVALRARWRRALASLTRLALASLHDHPFCLCSKLLSLLHLEGSTRSYILTLLTLLLLLTLIFSERFSRAGVSRRLLGSLAAGAAALGDSVAAAEPLLLYVVSLSALLSALQRCYL
ncbi:hypothetical protein COCSADRAFT_311945 [Bipolaris sorokiniana ND90Pr]|uniref:Uncharacterized protein n=1 Tax=Cochliobolus sativus (strain ND90Pr / ATCC 201652) TaxID=665912 RepID=M2TAW6_COCSN|nr:uncharacterized protein COCSADRAFT_311945 [Bipolaris sorokiniana ND90Pr]EMD66027.1 hypothetical protein COCSADRAFT_311945 [Bipolaris sorokiniana ND90Pr]